MRKIRRRISSARCMSFILCALLVMSMLPAAVFAEEEAGTEEAVEVAADVAEAVGDGEAEGALVDSPDAGESAEGGEQAASQDAAPAAETVVSSVIRTNELPNWPKCKDKSSSYVCLLDLMTDTVLIDKNMEIQTPPASLTKIMTVLVAIENGNLDDMVDMTQAGVDLAVAGSANLYTVLGESFKLKDLLYGIMLSSANDMAMQVAEYVGGGSVDNFVAMMNEKAQQLGCKATHFVNPTGLEAEGQLTTAYDFALICKEAFGNPVFREIASTTAYTIPATAIYAARELTNNFPTMSEPDTYKIKGLVGGKTGYTDPALYCLAAYCVRGGRAEVCVLLHCATVEELMRDCKLSFAYGYQKWKTREVALAEGEELVSGGKVLTPKKKTIEDCTTSESVTETEDGREKVDTTYYWSDVQVGTSSILRAKPTPEPTSIPAPVESVAAAADSSAAAAAGTTTDTGAAAGTAADAGAAVGTAAQAGEAAGTAADAAAAQPGAAAAGTAGGAAGAELTAAPAKEGAVSGQITASEPKASRTVTLPFGVTIKQNSFVAIAVLSLLILIGIIAILLTAIIKKKKD